MLQLTWSDFQAGRVDGGRNYQLAFFFFLFQLIIGKNYEILKLLAGHFSPFLILL